MNFNDRFRLVLLSVIFAACVGAQENPQNSFRETTPPPGLVKGFARTGDREGVVVAGGDLYFPGETFSVNHQGVNVVWKVLAVKDGNARLACAVSPSAPSHKRAIALTTPAPAADPHFTSNAGDFLELLKGGAEAHKAASTSVMKEQVLAETRANAKLWCDRNTVFCIQGVVKDLAMLNDNTARLRLTCPETEFANTSKHNLSIEPLQINIPISRQKALQCKAGHAVRLWGRPIFSPGTDNYIIDQYGPRTSFARFAIVGLGPVIGTLKLADPRYVIYDPATETAP